MPKKYARFLPTAESFNLEDFPYYWISQVNAQYVQNIDNVLKKYGLDNSRRRILLALNVNLMPAYQNYQIWSFQRCLRPLKSFIA